jgi:hypothetical protein
MLTKKNVLDNFYIYLDKNEIIHILNKYGSQTKKHPNYDKLLNALLKTKIVFKTRLHKDAYNKALSVKKNKMRLEIEKNN